MGHQQSTATAVMRESDRLVAIEKVAGRGSLPVSRRYTSSRPLEADYKISDTVLGTGLNGAVRLATCRRDGKHYAVKTFHKQGEHLEDFKSEAEIHLSLDHPHVAHLEMVYETERELHLVMEHMAGGELYERIADRKRCTEASAAEAMHQMLLAVAYLHSHRIAHRDLKLENFMYESKETNHLKLIDFGFAKHTDPCGTMSETCGSIHYVAPEVLAKSYTERADMWSMGIIAYMLLIGSSPFSGSDKEIIRAVKAGNVSYSPRFQQLSPLAQGFIRSLLVVDPASRFSAVEALDHPWIAGRLRAFPAVLDSSTLESCRVFARASPFKRTVFSMMAWSLNRSELRKQFLEIDTDKSGTISLQEFHGVLSTRFGVCAWEAEELFKCIDTDGDGEIEYNEFLAMAVTSHADAYDDMLRQTFSRFDADGDGMITRSELCRALGDEFSEDEVAAVFAAVDTSKDGKVDFREFAAFFDAAGDEGGERSPREEAGRLPRRVRLLLSRMTPFPPLPAEGDLLSAPQWVQARKKAESIAARFSPTRSSGRQMQMPALLTSLRAGTRNKRVASRGRPASN